MRMNVDNHSIISVVICTYNRCESLKDTLNSFLSQEQNGSFDYELIAVDNNSNDKTKEVVESYNSKFNGKLRYIFEARQGKSYAINAGIKEAKGEIVAFTDDDVIIDKYWLNNIYECFKNNDCDGIGGRIEPIWLGEKPLWLSEKLYGRLAILNYGNIPFQVKSENTLFYGANIIFKKILFQKFGNFNVYLGRKGNRLLSGEDDDIFSRFFKNGAKLIYQPNVLVYHKIPNERLRKAYFRKWHFDTAISSALRYSDSKIKGNFFGIPRYMIRELLENIGLYFLQKIGLNEKEAFCYECRIIFLLSFFVHRIF